MVTMTVVMMLSVSTHRNCLAVLAMRVLMEMEKYALVS